MSDRRAEGPESEEAPAPHPIPRDRPDQQAGAPDDPWEPDEKAVVKPADDDRADPDIPDTDEAGTGRRGAPHSASSRPEHPVPDEPTA
ncbi:hypothetical protein ACFV0T_36830 [Streptomyces sp. NPDC059582]|uniref:hypothetical protein n=1 Tax=Streptomyces sp. NPDC059582 TaxID=3346875 RepID=UPI003693CEF6